VCVCVCVAFGNQHACAFAIFICGLKRSRVFFFVLLTLHLSIFILVINQLDAQNICFTISLFHASTCFEHMRSSSGGQNCITQPLVSIGMMIPEAV